MISTPDNTWLCDSIINPDNTTIQGYCYDFLPIKNGDGAAYRFSKNDLINIWGWTNFSNNPLVFSVSNNTVLMSAL